MKTAQTAFGRELLELAVDIPFALSMAGFLRASIYPHFVPAAAASSSTGPPKIDIPSETTSSTSSSSSSSSSSYDTKVLSSPESSRLSKEKCIIYGMFVSPDGFGGLFCWSNVLSKLSFGANLWNIFLLHFIHNRLLVQDTEVNLWNLSCHLTATVIFSYLISAAVFLFIESPFFAVYNFVSRVFYSSAGLFLRAPLITVFTRFFYESCYSKATGRRGSSGSSSSAGGKEEEFVVPTLLQDGDQLKKLFCKRTRSTPVKFRSGKMSPMAANFAGS